MQIYKIIRTGNKHQIEAVISAHSIRLINMLLIHWLRTNFPDTKWEDGDAVRNFITRIGDSKEENLFDVDNPLAEFTENEKSLVSTSTSGSVYLVKIIGPH